MRRLAFICSFVVGLASAMPAASAQSEPVGSYIVVLKDSAGPPGKVANEHSKSQGAKVKRVYSNVLNGYSATMSATAAARIANDKRVSYVESDGVATKTATQTPATWGLDRIDQHPLPLNNTYTFNATGAGVTAYIIDTGVTPVSNFGGRVSSGFDFVDNDTNSADCDGHGTHVAGTVGSNTYGVAKGVSIVGVRVLDCSGSGFWSDVIAGIDWVAGHASGPAVANMSLGGGAITSVDTAVQNAIADGITFTVSAGNGNNGGKAQPACNYSPARVPQALTVGATSSTDAKASWSNYGPCVDLFAPGVSITSLNMTTGTALMSGTSMASPHAAGVAALYLETTPGASPASVANAINNGATPNVVGNEGTGSPDRLLYSLLTPPPPTPPVANNDSVGTTIDTAVTVNVLANDSDVNGDALTVTNLSTPGHGTAQVNPDNTVTYTPASGYTGSDSFTYTANDGTADSNVATVNVSVVSPPSGATEATVSYALTGGKNPRNLSITVVLEDANGNAVPNAPIEVAVTNGSSQWTFSGTTSSTGSVKWDIRNAPSGTYSTLVTKVAGDTWGGTTNDPGFTKP